jgi:hypothetical protein
MKINELTQKYAQEEKGFEVHIDEMFIVQDENQYINKTLDQAFEKFYDTNYSLRNDSDLSPEQIKQKLIALRSKYFITGRAAHENEKLISDNLTIPFSNLKNDVKIAVANMKVDKENIKKAFTGKSNTSKERRVEVLNILNDAEKNKSDFLILPELSIPNRWIPLLVDESRRKDRVIISGLEHVVIDNICYNFTLTTLPINVGGIKDAIMIMRLKNHYSPHEEKTIKNSGKIVPKLRRSVYNKLSWKKIHFASYNCYELADITHRTIFRSEVDLLFASEYNRDVNYFSNIVDTVSRDVHCYFIQANSSDFGDSRITSPSRTETKDILRLKGGANSVVLAETIDLESLREFQATRIFGQNSMKFKNTPPDYDHSKAEKRLLGMDLI